MILISFFSSYHTLVETRKKSMYVVAKDKIKMCIIILCRRSYSQVYLSLLIFLNSKNTSAKSKYQIVKCRSRKTRLVPWL